MRFQACVSLSNLYLYVFVDGFQVHRASAAGTLETRSQMRVGEAIFTAGDTGPWGTIMAVFRSPNHLLDPVTQFQVGKFKGSNVRGGADGVLAVAVVHGPKKEVSLARVPFISA